MKQVLLKTWLLVVCLLCGAGTTWAEEVTYTWTYSSSKFNVSSSGTVPAGSSASLTSTYTNANQLTGDKTQTFTLTGYDDCTITGVSINLKRSSSASAKANITVSANGEQIGSSSNLTLTTTQTDYPITVTSTKVGTGKNVVITVNAAANSIYVYNYKITYTAANKTTTTTTFGNGVDNQNFDFTQGDANFTKTATLSPAEAGSLTYSSSNTAVASVNSSTGEVTIGQAGKATIKAEYAGDANYAKSSAEYTVTVAPKGTPATYTITSTTAVSTTGTTPEGSAATYSQTYGTKCQMTNGNSTTLTLSGYAGCKINCIKLNMKSNGSSGAGTFSAVAGTTTLASIAEATTFDKWFDNTEYSSSYKDVLVTMDNTSYVIGDDENLVINIAATTSSLYINSYTIYYDLAIPAAEKPVITPADGTEFAIAPQQVTITSAPGATIYYTLDGTTPDDTKTLYEGAFDISATTTVKAIAYETDKRPSAVVSATLAYVPNYDINCNAPEGGSYTVKVASNEAQTITESTTIIGGQGKTITLTTTPSAGYKLASTPFTVKDADDADVNVSKNGGNYTFTMPGKNVTITANYSRMYTITAGTFEHGEITAIKDKDGVEITETSYRSKVVVEASADAHWNLASMYYVKEGEESQNEIAESEGVYSFTMPQSNVTVYATYTEDPKYNVSWVVNGAEVKAEELYGDVAVSAPEVDPIADKVFRGWVEDEIDTPQNEAPSYVNVSGLTVSADKTFHAVFATASGNASTDYSKITSMANLTDNDYVIAYDYNGGTQIAMGNTANGTDKINASALSLSDSKYANPDADYIWSIKKVSDGVYTLYNADADKYAKAISSGASLVDDPYNFTITWDNTNSCFRIQSTTNDTYYLHGYVSGTNYDFRSSTSGNGAKYHLHLYKSESTVSYSNFTTFVGYTRDVTDGNLGTICVPCAVPVGGIHGATFYSIAGKRVDSEGLPTSVVFEEVEELEAGVPYIFLAEADAITLSYTGEAVATAGNARGLYGTFEDIDFADDMTDYEAHAYYIINKTKIQKASSKSGVDANRAFIKMDEVSEYNGGASNRMLVVGQNGFEFEDGTITSIDAVETKTSSLIYDLQGRRVTNAKNGMYIVNGKKIIR